MAEVHSPTSQIVADTQAYVEKYMSQPHFDASHDYSHIERVVALSKHILSVEQTMHPLTSYDATVIELSALLHDVADHKYPLPSFSSRSSSPYPILLPFASSSISTHTPLPLSILLSLSCPCSIAYAVQEIIGCISYSTEVRSPSLIHATLRRHPELGIVQDADRLDALGAVGIGRAFTYAGARDRVEGEAVVKEGGSKRDPKGRKQGMQEPISHFEEKLLKLEPLMKTDEGRQLARERTRRIQLFGEWWVEECGRGYGGHDELE